MTTSILTLDTTQYVPFIGGRGSFILQSHRDTVRVAVSDTQPAKDTTAFHELGGAGKESMMKIADTQSTIWVLAMTNRASLSYTELDLPQVNLGTGINQDAWGRSKVINDFSLFHGLFTYSVPDQLWEEYSYASGVRTPLTATGTLASSVDHALVVESGTTADNGVTLRSKRHPRYQPNRGHLYSTALIAPNLEFDGIRRFGLIKTDNGVYFEITGDGADWDMFAVRKSNGAIKTRVSIKADLPAGFDPSKGNVYDIQYQWRGMGNYKWFVNLQEIYMDEILGTLAELSLSMPALPCCFESITNGTDNLTMIVGCVDVTSEGGRGEDRQFSSIATGPTLISTNSTGRAMIGLKMPRIVDYNGSTVDNTRDMVVNKIATWCRDEASVEVYFARDILVPNIDGLTWLPHTDGTDEFLIGGAGSALDNAFQLDRGNMQFVLSEWNDIEVKNVFENSDKSAPFYVSPGDILIIVIRSFAGNDDASATLYYSEEI